MILVVGAFLVALATLSSAINWPASLDDPAATALPRLLQQRSAVILGYSSYFLSSVLMIPMALALQAALARQRPSLVLSVATAFGVLAGAAKPLGIIRWLSAMPLLAQAYVDPATSDQGRETISVLYQMLNSYAGAVGELLGVALFGGLWALLLGIALLRSGQLPRWLGGLGVVVGGLSLLPLLEIAGVSIGPLLTLSNASWYLWVLATGITLLTRRDTKISA